MTNIEIGEMCELAFEHVFKDLNPHEICNMVLLLKSACNMVNSY